MIIDWLFETDAVRVCPENQPFWYTSGKIGPFYINTHFVYGSEAEANELLGVIDSCAADKTGGPSIISGLTMSKYEQKGIYTKLIDMMVEYIEKNIGTASFDYISGGERRDWFFSYTIAKLLNKPHITIYKDQSHVVFYEGICTENAKIDNSSVLHIADLITAASSYERAWVPAINGLNAKMNDSLVVVDRVEGGGELLKSLDVRHHSMIRIDRSFFETALANGLITDSQFNLVAAYLENPDASMGSFIQDHPEFLENALKSDTKTSARAKLCIEKGYYA